MFFVFGCKGNDCFCFDVLLKSHFNFAEKTFSKICLLVHDGT